MDTTHPVVAGPKGAGMPSLLMHAVMFVLSVIIIGLASYVIWVYDGWYGLGGPGYNIFCSLFTWFLCIYVLVSSLFVKKLYNRIVHSVLLAAGVVFWLSGWASMAAWAAALHGDTLFDLGYIDNRTHSQIRAGYGSAAAAAVFGAIIFILCIVNFIFNLVIFFRERKANRAAQPQPAPLYSQQPYGGGPPAQNYQAPANDQKQEYPMQNMQQPGYSHYGAGGQSNPPYPA